MLCRGCKHSATCKDQPRYVDCEKFERRSEPVQISLKAFLGGGEYD